mmetsp:Transcript_25602/g.37829  ORF Transcript_25602/g.37829 Transcript_25602/m.37829 type:complete len:323 (+) Transcript_25602:147-1115(+)
MSVQNERITRSRSRNQQHDSHVDQNMLEASELEDNDIVVIEQRQPESPPTVRNRLRTRSISVQTEAPPAWKLSIQNGSYNGSDIIQIFVTCTMTPKVLSRCILQACRGEEYYGDMMIVGLFQESDCLFVSLEDLIANRDSMQIYSLTYPEPHKSTTWLALTKRMLPVVSIVLIIYLYFYGQLILATTHEWSADIFEVVVNLPLRELYRYGPYPGWEGASLPKICARITYHGDEDFWRRNLEDCQQIYSAKEEAMMRMSRPFIYLLTLIVGFFTIRSLVREYALWLSKHMEKPDRNMVETYDAFRVLFRQMNRAFDDRKGFKN